MVGISKYRKSVIQIYSNTLTKYFEYNLNNQIKNPYYGWKVIIQILSMLYLIKMDIDQMSIYLDKSYILFNEYSEQISSTEFSEIHSPSVFVQKVLIGNIALNAYSDQHKMLYCDEQYIYIYRVKKWSEIMFHWNNIYITMEDRQKIHNTFTDVLLHVFLDNKLFNVYRIIEIIQSSTDHKLYAQRHIFVLNAFYTYIIKNIRSITHVNIQCISFNVFFKNKTELEMRFSEANTQIKMDTFVKWLFDQDDSLVTNDE